MYSSDTVQVGRSSHDYELTVLYSVECVSYLATVLERLVEQIKSTGFTPSSMNVDGIKGLAYPIYKAGKEEKKALYVDFYLSGQGDCSGLARALDVDKRVLRYLLVKCQNS